MKPLSLQSLDDTSILMKGMGYNKKLEAVSANKIPGSILVTSEKMSSSTRIYCIFDDMEGTWVFALSGTKPSDHQNILDFSITQNWDSKNRSHIEIAFPDDAKLKLEGEFSL